MVFQPLSRAPKSSSTSPLVNCPWKQNFLGGRLGRTASKKAGRLGIHVVRGRRPDGSSLPIIRSRNSQELLELSAEQNQHGGGARDGVERGNAGRHRKRGGGRARSPRARARGFYGARGGVGRAISPALQASERQDAEASLHGVSAGQDARSERPARWHGQSRPTQDVASTERSGRRGGVCAPQSPGSRHGAFMGQGEGLAVLSRRPCKRARGRMPKRACTE